MNKLITSIIVIVILFIGSTIPIFARTVGDTFLQIAERVPEFGGLFLSDNETFLNIYLTDITKEEDAKNAIQAVFGDRFLKQEIRILQGEYSYLELQKWYGEMSAGVFGIPGVILTDIDESQNRLKVGVDSLDRRVAVEEELIRLRIPLGAVIIEKAEPVRQAETLPLHIGETKPTEQEMSSASFLPVLGGLVVLIGGFIVWKVTIRRRSHAKQ